LQDAFRRQSNQSNFSTVMPEDSNVGQSKMYEAASTSFRARRTTRNSVATGMDDVEFAEPVKPRRRKKAAPVKYVKPLKKAAKRRSTLKFEWTMTKVGWLICLGLLVRLVTMEGGLLDYNSMDEALIAKQTELKSLRTENAEIIREIHNIKTSARYQKKLARDHLGVIAPDEYLVIFTKDR